MHSRVAQFFSEQIVRTEEEVAHGQGGIELVHGVRLEVGILGCPYVSDRLLVMDFHERILAFVLGPHSFPLKVQVSRQSNLGVVEADEVDSSLLEQLFQQQVVEQVHREEGGFGLERDPSPQQVG